MVTHVNPPKESWASLCKRPAIGREEIDSIVRDILKRVKNDGDKALSELSLKYDSVVLKDLEVDSSEIKESSEFISDELRSSIRIAISNIEKFHKAQLHTEPVIETSAGVKCWRKSVPLEIVGLYIPGGSAPLFSTVLMLAIPAKIAGCKRIILCTPPSKDGNINPLILYTAHLTGVTGIYKTGGAQAIAAMAYGTETIPPVDKIFGPGNQYVTRAKELIQLDGIPIDMPAGPSEVLVIADETADPAFVAADLLSQAEHGPDSQVLLVTTSPEIISGVMIEIDKQVRLLSRKKIALKALDNSMLIQLSSLQDCIDFSNSYAPEHLIISTNDPHTLAGKVRNAGSVFLGKYSCESAGDYATGTNHTLPTNGYARSYSGVSAGSFMKTITIQEVSPEGLKIIGPVIEKMAGAELLTAHRNAVTLRLKSLYND
ncbi:MAG: histidinol dehydrogenase [Bacteroidales bacterium]